MADFVHLHNHSHYSLLDGACRIADLVDKTVEYGMPAVALTDHGNMFGVIEFFKACKAKGVRPIIGSEVYVAPVSRFERGGDKKSGGHSYHLVLLCKNETGYKNLMKLVSYGYLEGFYYKPRIDHELLQRYSEGLVALSACLKGEVSSALVRESYEKALGVVERYRQIFGEDFYLEVQNHGIAEEDKAREGIFRLAAETGVKVVATNDIHYLEEEHWEAHDILLCLQTGKDYDDPTRMRYNSHQLFYKNYEQMAALFPGQMQALANTVEVADKCRFDLNLSGYHLPEFSIPDGDDSKTLSDYLRKLAERGMRRRYAQISPEIQARLDYELTIIKKMGYEGYFLITQDFIQYAKQNRIPVGPGRGSAAGSLVAYCLGITDLDPLHYDLYFERFLNPERVSMPDIDIDFCYERREEVIDYVKKKYGEGSVCQIITFGTMAARAVVRDVGRVLKMSYSDVDKIAKLIPTQAKSLDAAIESVKELRDLVEQDETHRKLIRYAKVLEGLARHSSTHAAGVVIAPGDLTDFVPLYKSKEGDVTTQYEMNVLESTGMLKMDFLGLRTLTVIQKAVDALRARGIDLDINTIPLDDQRVYDLFANGHTVGIFQFESSGMQEYLRKLKPNCIEDLIAMNALYRPGPMQMIDTFIDNKYGRKKVEYRHPKLEPILKNTYGVIVYQEQVMRIAGDLAGYSMGAADLLRRSMGKKKVEEMQKQRSIFIEGCKKNGIAEQTAAEIFQQMEEFANYGFNKSHSACYSVVAYQTAYLKAYYPAEFMAATISSEMGSSDRVTILLEECRRMGLRVLPPDVNESDWDFVVSEGSLRFGLGAVKNVGKGSVEAIVKERRARGPFKTIFELTRRVDPSAVNRKVLESMAEAGALDSLQGSRAQLFAAVEAALDFGQKMKKTNGKTLQASIFGDETQELQISEPPLPKAEEWNIHQVLAREKEILGFYLSGHPLNNYREDVRAFSTITLDQISELRDQATVRVCGMVTELKTHMDRKNRPMAFLRIEDFTGSVECLAFADTYETYRSILKIDEMVVISGRMSSREGAETKIMVNEVYSLDQARKQFTRNLIMALELEHLDREIVREIRGLLTEHAGEVPVYFQVKTPQNGMYMLRSKSLRVQPNLELIEHLRDKLGRQNVWLGA